MGLGYTKGPHLLARCGPLYITVPPLGAAGLPVRGDGGADGRPVVHPFGGGGRQVDAAVAHRVAEVVVPVGAVDRVARVEVHGVGHRGQVVILRAGAAAHVVGQVLGVDVVGADHRRVPGHAGRDECME